VTLTRLGLAWLPVAAWLVASGYGLEAWRPGELVGPRATTAVSIAESVVLTLLASLWFDSLGHGGWWLIFLLLGLLQALPGLMLRRQGAPRFAAAVARYVLAGAILAWRLG
jgi:uncharacterized membrane protein